MSQRIIFVQKPDVLFNTTISVDKKALKPGDTSTVRMDLSRDKIIARSNVKGGDHGK